MGRDNTDRQTAKFSFLDKKVKIYRPTDGQMTAILLAAKGGKLSTGEAIGAALVRIFRVLEALVVNPEDWEFMDDAMVMGDASVSDFNGVIEALMKHEWPDA